MKGSMICIIGLLLLAARIVSKSKSASTPQTCLQLNPLLNVLRVQGVVLPEYPTQRLEDARCSREWQAHGSCCEVSSLARYALKDTAEIMASVSQLLKGFNFFAGAEQKFSGAARAYLADNSASNSTIRDLANALVERENSRFFALLSAPGRENFANSARKCWERFASVRAKSLCGLCSAQSGLYLNRKKKISIEESLCSLILGDCMPHFEDLHTVSTSLEALFPRFKQATQRGPVNEEFENYYKRFESDIRDCDRNRLTEFMGAYLRTHGAQNGKNQDATHPGVASQELAYLCNHLVRLVEGPIIGHVSWVLYKQFNAIGSGLLSLAKNLERSAKNQLKAAPKLQPEWEVTTGRQLTQMSDKELNGDVAMFAPAKMDSSYAAVFGAIGTSGNEAALFLRPLPINLTMEFP